MGALERVLHLSTDPFLPLTSPSASPPIGGKETREGTEVEVSASLVMLVEGSVFRLTPWVGTD
jgi:hypothetical protein